MPAVSLPGTMQFTDEQLKRASQERALEAQGKSQEEIAQLCASKYK